MHHLAALGPLCFHFLYPRPQTLNFTGFKLSASALLVAPSKTYSDINLPVPGPFWMPQHVWPAATKSPGTVVGPTNGPLSCPNRTCLGR